MTLGVNMMYEISEEIKNGAIAYQLGRPYNYVLYSFSNIMGTAFLRLVLYSLIGYILGVVLVGAPPIDNLLVLPFFVISVALALIIQFFILMSIGLTAFFVEENRPFFFIYQKLILMLGTFIPLEFFPQWMQMLLKYLPFSFITWGPAKIVVDFSIQHALTTIIPQLIWSVIAITICFSVYRKGVRSVHVHGG